MPITVAGDVLAVADAHAVAGVLPATIPAAAAGVLLFLVSPVSPGVFAIASDLYLCSCYTEKIFLIYKKFQ
jgi:hypothetical protein